MNIYHKVFSYLLIIFTLVFFFPKNALAVQNSFKTKEYKHQKSLQKWTAKISSGIKYWKDITAQEKSAKKTKLYGILSAIFILVGIVFVAINIPILLTLGLLLFIAATVFFTLAIYHGNISYYKDADKGAKYQFVKITVLAIAGFLVIISNMLYYGFRR